MKYIINGTGNKFQDGFQVKHVIESDILLLDKTFETLKYIKEIRGASKISSVTYEMCFLYNIRTLKQICCYQIDESTIKEIRTSYFSRIESKFVQPNAFFVGVNDSFKNLHRIESVIDDNGFISERFTPSYPKFVAGGYVVEQNAYEAMIKDALIAIRFDDYL